MVDDDFDDLLAGVEMLQDSSQELLTFAAANLDFCESGDSDDLLENLDQPDGDVDSSVLADDAVPREMKLQSQLSSQHISKYKLVWNSPWNTSWTNSF